MERIPLQGKSKTKFVRAKRGWIISQKTLRVFTHTPRWPTRESDRASSEQRTNPQTLEAVAGPDAGSAL